VLRCVGDLVLGKAFTAAAVAKIHAKILEMMAIMRDV
jgi:hypothetical protein